MLQINDDGPSWRESRTRMDIYSVRELARYLQESLEANAFLQDLWVSGELSNVKRSPNGHLYFSLKESGAEFRCVMFRASVPRDLPVVDGTAVVAHGRIGLYEVRGDLQFRVDVLMPQGMGALHLEFEALRAKLEAEGLFDRSRKRPLPDFPRRIVIMTSPAGAVLHDIVTVTARRYPLVELLVLPIAVQGETASRSIAEAFQKLRLLDDVDAVILARGGGSIEDLWPFNEEITARTIYASPVPVVSAVGHETDVTIADLVADVRAPTPSVAAELAVPSRADLLARVGRAQARLHQAAGFWAGRHRSDVASLERRLRRAAPDVDRDRQRVDELARRSVLYLQAALAKQRSGVDQCLAALGSLDPRRTLERGYAIVYDGETRKVVTTAGQVTAGAGLVIEVSDGVFDATAGAPPTVVPPPPLQTRRTPRPAPEEQLALFGN